MLDLQIIDLVASRLEDASRAGGWIDADGNPYGVSQKEQPTQQGVPTNPQIFFEKLFDVAFGYPEVSTTFDAEGRIMSEVEVQLIETTFQISALVIQEPTDLTIPTASDVVNFLRSFIVARQTIRKWRNAGASVLRVSEIRNPYFEDDRHRNEATPSFDIVVTHSRTLVNTIEFAEEMDGGIFPVE